VTVLEGRTRTGGRVYTGRLHETRIDLGAAWLHGLEGNPLAELALARLPTLKLYKNNEQAIVLFDREGRQMDSAAVFEGYMKFVQLLDTLQSEFNPEERDGDDEGAQGYEAWKRTQPRIQASLQDAITELYAKHAKLHYVTEQDKVVMQFMFSQLESLQGAAMVNLNARDYDHGITYEGGDNIVVSGFQNISMMLSADLDCIQLGQKVERIEWQPTKGDEVAPPPPTPADASAAAASAAAPKATLSSLPKVRVHVEKGTAPIDCHGVVVTSSIGVLKSGMTTFNPPLPPWKQSSIAGVGSGLFNKVVMRFSKSFWPASADYIGFNFPAASTAADRSLDVAHAERSNSWFVNYEPVSKVPILIAMLTGPLAEAMEKLPDAEVVAEMVRRLTVMFGADNVSQPTDILVTRWGQDPYACGSYSYLRKGSAIGDFEHIGAPVGRSIFWAGEHTSTDRFGYADGAYVSGLREAERIIGLYAHLGQKPTSKL
jgi:monoamine oxidase